MAVPTLDLILFTPAELNTYFAAAKAELVARMSGGKVTQGASASQSYGFQQYTIAELTTLVNSLTAQLGGSTGMNAVNNRVRPNFSRNPRGCYRGAGFCASP